MCLQVPEIVEDDRFVEFEASETPVEPKLEVRKSINFLYSTVPTLSISCGYPGQHVHVSISG